MRIAVSDVHGGLTQFSPLQALCHRIVCAQVNNPFAAAEFILPAGMTACLAQALHLVCLLLVLFRSASSSAGWWVGELHTHPCCPRLLWPGLCRIAGPCCLCWVGKIHVKAFFPFLESKPAVEKRRRRCPLSAALKKTEGGTKEKHLQKHGK